MGKGEGILIKSYSPSSIPRDAANAFAIFCLFFLFGVRASELSAIHRDYHPDKSCIDMDNSLLHIRGTIRHHTYQNKTKNRINMKIIKSLMNKHIIKN